jgi:hypothetical protein
MASKIITSSEFAQYGSELDIKAYKYRILVEGDSWMDRSSLLQPSLLPSLAKLFDKSKKDVLFINIARFGDTLENMGGGKNRELELWIKTQFAWKFDAMLFSGGGNDYIDAAADQPPGQGLIRDVRGTVPGDASACVNQAALDKLGAETLREAFSRIHAWVQTSQHAGMPIFLNAYDTPTARPAPGVPGGQAWLHRAYVKNGIPGDIDGHSLYGPLTRLLFDHLRLSVGNMANGRAHVHVVPSSGLLTPAKPGSTGSDGDWLNEIHPNTNGWKKLAQVWFDTIHQHLK